MTIAGRAALVVISTLVALLIGEYAARLILGDRVAPRTLYFSAGTFVAEEGGAVHYRAKSRLRTRAVYGQSIEYDVTFPVNNLGYIDSQDYARTQDERAVAVVGDSFTAGYHGGEPWVPKLRGMPELGGRDVYNIGVDGIGTQAFLRNLRFAETRLAFDTVLMVALTEDFLRPLWRPVERGELLWMCPPEHTDSECATWDTDLRVLASGTAMPMAAGARAGSVGSDMLLAMFPTLYHLQSQLRDTDGRIAPTSEAVAATFGEFRSWGGNRRLIFLHMPIRGEVLSGSFVSPLGQLATTHGITYVSGLECGLARSDYLPIDGHPNASGFAKILTCAAGALRRAQ